jgi:hypothetical protein
MNQISTAQLAELLVGIARSQHAIIDAIESMKPGFKGTHLAPALDSAAKTRVTGRPLSLFEFPARVLAQCQSRSGPNLEQVTRDLEALLKAASSPPAPAGPAPRSAAAPAQPAAAVPAPPSKGDPDSLDMT